MLRLKKNVIGAEAAETLAVQALSFLAQDEDRLNAFLTSTGLDVETLRRAAAEPQFLSILLDYVTADDTLVLALAAEANMPPESVSAAAQYFHKDEF